MPEGRVQIGVQITPVHAADGRILALLAMKLGDSGYRPLAVIAPTGGDAHGS